MNTPTIEFGDFLKVDMRVGKILEAKVFEQAKKPAYQLLIDFGEELGNKRSSAQITHHYSPKSLLGRQVIAVVNFPPKQIANMMSEVLVLGLSDGNGDIVLLQADQNVPLGSRVH